MYAIQAYAYRQIFNRLAWHWSLNNAAAAILKLKRGSENQKIRHTIITHELKSEDTRAFLVEHFGKKRSVPGLEVDGLSVSFEEGILRLENGTTLERARLTSRRGNLCLPRGVALDQSKKASDTRKRPTMHRHASVVFVTAGSRLTSTAESVRITELGREALQAALEPKQTWWQRRFTKQLRPGS